MLRQIDGGGIQLTLTGGRSQMAFLVGFHDSRRKMGKQVNIISVFAGLLVTAILGYTAQKLGLVFNGNIIGV